MRRSLLSALFAALLISGFVLAQASFGHIHGVVRDANSRPMAGVQVVLSGANAFRRTTLTGETGEFWFRDIGPGPYSIAASLTGFLPAKVSTVVAGGFTREITIVLMSAPAPAAAPAPPPPPNAAPVSLYDSALMQSARVAGVAGGIVGGIAGRPGFNTEAYDKIDDNQWTEVSRRPLSTFSSDVDTASYANVRRFLNHGQLPPKDAVRIEELINYFSYEYPEPAGDKPFTVTTAIGECPWNPKHRLALIGLQARHLDNRQTPPRNLVFLVDVSGSMAMPMKLPLVKASLAMLARNLTGRDRIAIVVYAGNAGLVLPSVSGGDPMTVLEALGRLEAGGSTNGAQGIKLAYQVARDHFVHDGVNRVILATDGDFNVGVTNQGDLIRLIEENRESGVTLSVLGFGMGNLKDSTMEKLADRGNGNYSYIDSLSEAQKVLVEEAGGTLVTLAKDVKLQIEFNPRVVAAYRLVGYENRLLQDRDFNDDKKDAGDMGAGHSVTALYELAPVGEKLDLPGIDPLKYQRPTTLSPMASREEAMTVKVRYKEPDGVSSSLMSVAVPSRSEITAPLGFAAAVAEFGMLLRDSEFKGQSTYASATDLASKYKGADEHGHRAEFLRLISAADSVSRVQASGR
jgi:Ca-activated chloride channel family protein